MMKRGSQNKATLAILLAVIALILSGCYTEPVNITSGTDTSSGNTVPYPVFSVEPDPTDIPVYDVATPEVVQTPVTIVQLPGGNATPFISGVTPTPNAGGTYVQLPTGTPAPQTNTPRPSAVPAATPAVLRFGSQGKAVRELQTALKKLGYYTGLVDGDYGESTKRAVTAFQRANGLTADGVAGAKTLELLNGTAATARPTATPKPKATATPKLATSVVLQLRSKGSEVSRMQTRLISLGYLDGKATGTFDAITELAVTSYQNRSGLTGDGVAGFTTLNSMYSARAIKATTSSGIIGVTLKTGSGEVSAIRTLQRRLKSLGYYTNTINGTYGSSTKEAVSNFQKQNGMKADGVAGPSTFTKLFTGTPNRYSATATPKRTATPRGSTRVTAAPAARTTAAPANPAAPKITNPPAYVTVTEAPNGAYVTLQMGDGGTLVGNLQRALKKLGYYTGNISSHYAATTYRGVMNFQLDSGLKATGIADGNTQRRLFSAADATPVPKQASTPTPTPKLTNPPEYTTVTAAPDGKYVTLKMGDGGTLVANLQRALKQLGYYTGNISSHYAATTYNGVRAFQKDYGLTQNGIANAATQTRLFAAVHPTAAPKPTATNPPVFRTVTNPPVNSDYITLRVGDSGEPVKLLQQALKKHKYFTGTVDGKYGQSTYDAVLAFQKANNLRQTGVANAATQRMLFGVTPTATPSPVPVTNPPSYRTVTNPPVGSNYVTLKMGDSGAPVELLQRALRNGGYFKGDIDGRYGASTYQAVLKFQANNGLKQTGSANAATQELLFGGKYNRTPTPAPKTPTPTPKKTPTPTPAPAGGKVTNPPTFRTVTEKPGGGYISLKLGDKGTPVVKLQSALRRAGYYKGNSDGNFGTSTYQAVMAYQQNNKMNATGTATVTLQQHLFGNAPKAAPTRTPKPTPSPTPKPSPTPRLTNPPSYRTVTEAPPNSNYITLKMGDEGVPVKMLQEILKQKGYYKGTVDGKYDVQTFNAVIAFQKDKGLKQTGVANAATQIILYQGDFPDES